MATNDAQLPLQTLLTSPAVVELSSTSIFTNLMPVFFAASSANTGAIALQGPHHLQRWRLGRREQDGQALKPEVDTHAAVKYVMTFASALSVKSDNGPVLSSNTRKDCAPAAARKRGRRATARGATVVAALETRERAARASIFLSKKGRVTQVLGRSFPARSLPP